MNDLKQLLIKRKNNKSIRQLAEELEISTRTVQDYLKKVAEACDRTGLTTDDLIAMDDHALDEMMFKGNEAYSDGRLKDLLPLMPHIKEELAKSKKTHVTRQILYEEYREKCPGGYGRTQFFEHVARYLEDGKKEVSTPKMSTYQPGEYLYVDFAGDKILLRNPETGEERCLETFVCVLPYSCYIYVILIESQRVEDFLYGLRSCLEHIGGVPKVLVPDNLKSAVLKHDRSCLKLNEALREFGNHYGMDIVPARVRKPKDKSLVEDGVQITYVHVYAKLRNVQVTSVIQGNEQVSRFVKMYNQSKVVESRGGTREDLFHAKEKPFLRPLPAEPYEYRHILEQEVGVDGTVKVPDDGYHKYSVPYQHIGRHAHMEYTRTTLYVYVDNVCVASHARVSGPGESIKEEHMSEASKAYLNRSPDNYIMQASAHSPSFGLFAQFLFLRKTGRRSDAVLYDMLGRIERRRRKTDPDVFDRACDICRENGIADEDGIFRVISSLETSFVPRAKSVDVNPADGSNTRGGGYYK